MISFISLLSHNDNSFPVNFIHLKKQSSMQTIQIVCIELYINNNNFLLSLSFFKTI